jgi:hypothetical protein
MRVYLFHFIVLVVEILLEQFVDFGGLVFCGRGFCLLFLYFGFPLFLFFCGRLFL